MLSREILLYGAIAIALVIAIMCINSFTKGSAGKCSMRAEATEDVVLKKSSSPEPVEASSSAGGASTEDAYTSTKRSPEFEAMVAQMGANASGSSPVEWWTSRVQREYASDRKHTRGAYELLGRPSVKRDLKKDQAEWNRCKTTGLPSRFL